MSLPKKAYNVDFVVEYLNQTIDDLRDMIVDTYADLYAPEEAKLLNRDVDSWQLYDMAACILIDGMKKNADD